MKTPREILLSRHAQANPKLDVLRHEVVNTVAAAAKENREFTFAATARGWLATPFRELIWRPRWIWSSLAAIWLVILVANIRLNADSPRLAAKTSPNPTDFILTLREQERVMAEFTGTLEPQAVIAPKRDSPQPRSEALDRWKIV